MLTSPPILSLDIDFSLSEQEIVEVNNHAGEISRGVHCQVHLDTNWGLFSCRYSVSVTSSDRGKK